MSSFEIGSMVVCAECGEDSEIEFIDDYNGTTGYSLSCNHRNAYCKTCNQMAWDVSDTHREVRMMCNNCPSGCEDSEPPELMEFSASKNHKKSRLENYKFAPSYTLDDLRKVHKRSYLKWSDDEGIALSLFIDEKNSEELSALFNRQSSAIESRRCKQSDKPIPNTSAIRFLGTKIKCNSCNHETILCYQHLEIISEKLRSQVLNLHLVNVTEMAKFFSCKECKSKGATFLL